MKRGLETQVTRPEPDPRMRPFRAAAYGVHTTITAAFCVFITWNVVQSVRAMTPAKIPPVVGAEVPVGECFSRAQTLWQSLEGQRQALGSPATPAAKLSTESWALFRVDWLKRLRVAQAECTNGSGDRARVGRVFLDLERLEDLYTTHAVQYVGEIAPTLNQFRADLDGTK